MNNISLIFFYVLPGIFFTACNQKSSREANEKSRLLALELRQQISADIQNLARSELEGVNKVLVSPLGYSENPNKFEFLVRNLGKRNFGEFKQISRNQILTIKKKNQEFFFVCFLVEEKGGSVVRADFSIQ